MKNRTILLTLSMIFLQSTLFAATYYVSPSGSNANPGTQAQPFQTLNKGVSVLTAGDTLKVMPGTYAEVLKSVIPSGSDAAHPVTLTAFDPANRPIIQPPPGSNEAIYILGSPGVVNSHDIVIDHWVIDSTFTNTQAAAVDLFGYRITVSNSEIKNGHNHGVSIIGNTNSNQPSDNDQLLNLDVHNISNGVYAPYSGIEVGGSHTLVQGCTVHDNDGVGILLIPDINNFLPIQFNTVKGNRIYNNRSYVDDSITVGSQGIRDYFSAGNDVLANNVIYGNQGAGIEANAGFNTISNIQILNNTVDGNNFSDSSGEGIGLGFASSCVIADNIVTHENSDAVGISNSDATDLIENNLFYSNPTQTISDYAQSATQSGNIFNSDPLYVDLANANVHLNAASPAINAGLPFSQVANDYDGVARPQGNAPDIGAYESLLAPTAPPINVPSTDLNPIKVYPSPWRSDLDGGHDLSFDNVPQNSTLKIFTVSGHWVKTISNASGKTTWNLKNDAGQDVASGLYLYLITDGHGNKARGKFGIIR